MQEKENEQWSGSSFKAFISYSHADAHVVRKLHSQLESYRLPKGLGEISSQNAGPRDLGRIFRDREYLSVAQDLSSTVKSALERSEVLVVICSPEAKASQWVEREIEYFRNLHPDRPILAALVEGEPEEAFPPALLKGGLEPLAADLRKAGDGWKLGFLKLVAGIVGVPLDALIQRDSQRQTTRVMAVTGVLAVFALCMTAMAFVAIQARNEAQFQQGQAEELIAFMMGDLREALRGVGRLDILEDVAEQALAYFDAQSEATGLSPDSLGKRAIVRHAIGAIEIEREGGDFDEAREVLETAFATTKAGLDGDPDNPDRIFEHAQSHYWLGYLGYTLGDLVQTETGWKSYRELTTKLYQIDPSNPEWVSEAAYGEGNVCTIELIRGTDLGEAENTCRASLDLFGKARSLEPDNPTHLVNIANRHAWLGGIHKRQGNLAKMKQERLAAEETTNLLLQKDPNNRDWQDLWLVMQIALAEDELAAGENGTAHERIAEATRVAEELVAVDPQNKAWNSKLETIRKLGGSYVQ
jgi:tetratricopeptide (TPR) repeat protein